MNLQYTFVLFLQVAVDEDDLRDGIPIASKAVVMAYVEKYSNYFLEICLQGKNLRLLISALFLLNINLQLSVKIQNSDTEEKKELLSKFCTKWFNHSIM